MAVTLGIYYALPWLRWHRGPDLPDQAVLLDMANNRFFFFFLEIWPQEFYFITGLLVLAALTLFLITSVAGRVWCGYTCPQTVWTDLMIVVERFWQGDRNARMRLDKEPLGAGQALQEGHDAPLLARHRLGDRRRLRVLFPRRAHAGHRAPRRHGAGHRLSLPRHLHADDLRARRHRPRAGLHLHVPLAAHPGRHGRPRDAAGRAIASYRGEPRGPHKKGQPWEGRGDCIDCTACVAVCPTGIDIRDGSQLECIQCALCIDACNDIMGRIGRPRGLIGYDTIAKQEAAAKGATAPLRLIRARTLLYAALIGLVGAIMLVALLNRTTLEINVLHDRNPPYVLLSDGGIRNGYTVKILNKLHQPREFSLETRGLPGARLAIVGMDAGAKIRVTTDDLRELRVLVTLPPSGSRAHREQRNSLRPGRPRCRVGARDGTHHAIPEAGSGRHP